MIADMDSISGSCGVGVAYNFRQTDPWGCGRDVEKITTDGGCGWTLVSFVDGYEVHMGVYETLKQRWKIIYQSPVKLNINSGNKFFFCIFESPDEEPRGFDQYTVEEYLDRRGEYE